MANEHKIRLHIGVYNHAVGREGRRLEGQKLICQHMVKDVVLPVVPRPGDLFADVDNLDDEPWRVETVTISQSMIEVTLEGGYYENEMETALWFVDELIKDGWRLAKYDEYF